MRRKRCIVMMAAVFCCLTFTACTAGSTKNNPGNESTASGSGQATYQTITASQAKDMMEDGKPYILLDVRTEEEFRERRIDGAILIPDYEIGARAEQALPDKDARILIYCRSGRRSALAADKMIQVGYTNVYDFGGIIDWPYDTVSG